MPRVPTYEQTELLRPVNRQGMASQASPEAFGAGVGRAMQSVAGGIADVSDTMSAIETLEAENIGRERTNAYSDELMTILHDPETGYKNLSGKNALDARQATEQRIQQARRRHLEGLTGRAAQVSNAAFDTLERDARRTVTLHAGQELKTHTTSTIEAAASNFQNQALLNFNDKPLFEKYSAAALQSVERMGQLQGWSAEQLQAKKDEVQSNIIKRAALRVAEADPLAVEAYIEANADKLTATDRYDLETGLEAKIQAARDERDLLGLIGGDITQARTPVEEFIDTTTLADTVILAESSGRTDAVNPNSSAAGSGQFLADTWVEQVRKHKPGLAAGMSDEAILKLRTDGTAEGQRLQREMINAYAHENAKVLQKAGITVTPASLHLAHFLGPYGARAVLSASDDTPLSSVASPAARQANPEVFSSNRTVGDLKTWAADRAMHTAVRAERNLENAMAAPVGALVMEKDAQGYWQTEGVEYALEGKTRSKPVSKQFLERIIPAVRSVDPSIGIRITSGGQAPKGSGGPRTGSTRHDVDHTGHAHTADFVLVQNGKAVTPGEAPELYAKVLEASAAAGFTGIGHYDWGVHVGGGSEAAWGPTTGSASLAPWARDAIERGRARRMAGGGIRPQPAGSVQVSSSTIEQRAMLIEPNDPIRRQKLIDAAMGVLGTETSRREAAQKAARDQAWAFITQGGSVKDIPATLLEAMGPSNFSSVSSAADALQDDPAESNPELLYDIRRQQGNDPEAFAQRDLLADFSSGKLSRSDFDTLAKEQSSALADKRKAAQDGFNISTAMSIADAQLEAVGIKKTPAKMNQEDRERVARFQNALMNEMAAFQRDNQRSPTQPEVQSIINRMLLPVVTQEERSIWNPLKTPWSKFEDREGFMFEIPFRPDGTTVDIVMEYTDVPAEWRDVIANDLTLELGRKPTPEEVVDRYEMVVMSR